MPDTPAPTPWALIIGSSSGFGEATSRELASCGLNVFGVHFDRRATLPHVEEVMAAIRAAGRDTVFFNINAADTFKRADALNQMQAHWSTRGGEHVIKVVLHSIAFGALKPYLADSPENEVTQAQLEMTLDVMANSLVYWTQGLIQRKLMGAGGKIFAMTSSGGTHVWPTYGAVSAAKAALEAHVRQLAYELAPLGISANSIRAGVTDTPALRKIPGNENLIAGAMAKNPHRRLTTPQDVASAIAVLCTEGTRWITGNVIGVDGGEDLTG